MRAGQQLIIRYSKAFKQHVVVEIETGRLTFAEAVRKYGISQQSVIQNWCKSVSTCFPRRM